MRTQTPLRLAAKLQVRGPYSETPTLKSGKKAHVVDRQRSPPRASSREASPSPAELPIIRQPALPPVSPTHHDLPKSGGFGHKKIPTARQQSRRESRQSSGAAHIRASEARGRQEEKGAEDAKQELDNLEGKVDEPSPPPPGNDQPSSTSPQIVGDRYYFTPISEVSKLPVYLSFAFPTVLLCFGLALHHSCVLSALYFSLLVILVAGQSAVLWFVNAPDYFKHLLTRLRPVAIAEVAALPLSAEAYCEYVHTNPEFESLSWLTCTWLWYLQCLTAVTSNCTSVISGVSYHMFTAVESLTHLDLRLPNHRGNKAEPDRVTYDGWTVTELSTGLGSVRVSSEDLARQFESRLKPLSVDDRRLQAENMAARVSNLAIQGKYSPEVTRGSADCALAYCSASDASKRVWQKAASVQVWACYVPSVVVVQGLLLMLAPVARYTATLAGVSEDWIVSSIFVAPVLEELVKLVLAKLLHTSRLVTSPTFGIIEFMCNGLDRYAAPALLMHCLNGLVDTPAAMFIHLMFNTTVFVLRLSQHSDEVDWAAPYRDAFGTAPTTIDDVKLRTLCDLATNPVTQRVGHAFTDNPWFTPELCVHLTPSQRQFASNVIQQDRTCVILDGAVKCVSPDGGPAQFFSATSAATTLALSLFCIAAIGITRSSGVRKGFERLYAVGYRVGEVRLPAVSRHGAKIKRLPTFFMNAMRTSACCSLGFILRRVVPVFPDFGHPATALHGCLHRFCKNPPRPDRRKLRRLRRFVRRWVLSHYDPIPGDADVSVETWLAGTDYPEWRKNELRRVWEARPWIEKEDFINKSFIKKEHYTQYKPARGINSRSDRFKCETGRFFKLMEQQLYSQPCFDGVSLTPGEQGPFIKHIPVHLRPQFIERMLGCHDGPYYETDYSQFEKHFTPEIMMSLELILYKHMMKNFPRSYQVMEEALSGMNRCIYKGFVIKILGRRMSGDMCTSLGNGFSNLMLFKFAAHDKGGHAVGIVEGDDALYYSTVQLTAADFKSMGFDIKVDVHDSLYSSSFCGMLMSEDGILLRDFFRVIPKFGWTFSPRRIGGDAVRMGLLRARALSLAYESPRCPVIFMLALRALEVTYGFKPIFEKGHHNHEVEEWSKLFSDQMYEDLTKGPSRQARVDYAQKFHLSVPMQLRLEEILSQWSGEPLDHPLFNSVFAQNDDLFSFADNYVAETEALCVGLVDSLGM